MIPRAVDIREAGVYRIANKVTWQCYYGRAKTLATRYVFDSDGYPKLNQGHNNQRLLDAWLEYGRENFVFEILQICDLADVKALEQYYLDNIVQWGFDYNVSPVARGNRLTPEQQAIATAKIVETRRLQNLKRRGMDLTPSWRR